MFKLIAFGGIAWLAAAYLHDYGGDDRLFWAALLPLGYLVALTILRDSNHSR